MPIDYSKYPADWKKVIRPRILARADCCCEGCGVRNYTYLSRPRRCCASTIWDERNRCCSCRKPRPRVVLTIAHLDHDITNNADSNLKALCQKCHLRHDARQHAENARKTREARAGQLQLFPE